MAFVKPVLDTVRPEIVDRALQSRNAGLEKGRATQAHSKGKISSGELAATHARANRAIGHTFHSHRGTKS